jgi:hypothetical protein
LKALTNCDILKTSENDTTARGGVSMANEEHVKMLKQGVEVWNRWREENPVVRPNLSEAGLTRANLSQVIIVDYSEANLIEWTRNGANLSEANLCGADLSGADLSGAHLSGADLHGADLSEADLRGANLRGANLRGANVRVANLSEANLSVANLYKANLTVANLYKANLSEAVAGTTTFAALDLSVVKGLETIEHRGPSTIGIDTIYRSKGKIPEAFLRGAGVPDTFITYVHSLTGEAIQYYSCFISYSSQDEAFAQRLHNHLQGQGVRCWFAPEDMKIGDKIRFRVDESIRIYDKLLLILSKSSIASQWVEHEVEHALDLERERGGTVLFPVRLDETVMGAKVGWAGSIRRSRHIGDFCQWKEHDAYKGAFDRLLRDLKAGEK